MKKLGKYCETLTNRVKHKKVNREKGKQRAVSFDSFGFVFQALFARIIVKVNKKQEANFCQANKLINLIKSSHRR